MVRPTARKRTQVRTFVLLTLAGIALNLAPLPAAWVERIYLGVLHPAWLAVTAGFVGSITPSVSGVALIVLVSAPLLIAFTQGRRGWSFALKVWASLFLFLLFTFPLAFGFGYKLPPLVEADWLLAPLSGAEHERALEVLVAQLATADSVALPAGETTAANASVCVASLVSELRGTEVELPTRVKLLPPGTLLRFGFAGVVSPWLLEPHIDAGLPPAAALGVALHEFAHVAGYAREAEAEAVGLVAGLNCHDATVAYGAAVSLASAVARELPAGERATFMDSWPPTARQDAEAYAAAAARFKSPAAEGAQRLYGTYLKSQGEAGGMLEYGRGVDLALKLLVRRQAPSL